jgi:adenosylcobinamide-phosphate synthase
MSFLALLFALLIEQARPLSANNWIHRALRAWIVWVSQSLDAGQKRHALKTWLVVVGVPSVLTLAIHWSLMWWIGWPVAMLWSVLVLYSALGFRQFSHHFTDIRDALEAGDESLARELLAKWKHVNVGSLPRSELLRHVIEHSVLSAHRHVFGVLAWFSILAALGLGPAGAVIYRMSAWVHVIWQNRDKEDKAWVSDALQQMSSQAWHAVDWVPARLTALAFAVVGNFEEAIDCWRNHAQRFPNDNDGVVLSATSGALGVRLGGEALGASNLNADTWDTPESAEASSESTPGRAPELAHFYSLVGLVWRSVVMWMVLLALLTLARLLG